MNQLNVEKKITVLYIAGTGRNGSTLLERILNELPFFFTAGELGAASKVLNKHRQCVCGEQYQNCSTWKNIVTDPDFEKIDKDSFSKIRDKYWNNFNLLKIKLKKQYPIDFKNYLNDLETIYQVIYRHSGGKIITDSTCHTLYGHHLSLIPSIELYVVHLIRDPRGVVHSWDSPKYTSKGVLSAPRIKPLPSTFTWIKRNLILEFLFSKKKYRYLKIHYEDFIEHPERTLRELNRFLNIELTENNLNFIKGKTVELDVNHLSWGNLNSFEKGVIYLKQDDRWKNDMTLINRLIISLITYPFRLKFNKNRKYN
ncbi:MAG: sulfotransferase [Pseudomonadota bacterium]|nr:sulfotransferase [Pseudomonadota bacterium]